MTGVTEELPATEADADVEGPRPRGGVAGRPTGGLPAGSRAYPLVALAAIVSGVAGIGFAQLDSDLNPLHVTVSEYAVADRGGRHGGRDGGGGPGLAGAAGGVAVCGGLR
ncbi:hypothetical protein ACFSTC_56260 [Nonomuraea ferruginea]